MSNTKFQISNQCQNPNIKIWHLNIGISIDIWVLEFVITDAVFKSSSPVTFFTNFFCAF